MRKAMKIRVGGAPLVGTFHQPSDEWSGGAGVLLLNFGQQPRSWMGDLAVRVADRLCENGYGVFRFDMPGLGDSIGDVPEYLQVLWRQIQNGAHVSTAADLCRELVERFRLKVLLVGGFCGGAVTAVLAAARSVPVAGLVLLEPEFVFTQLPDSAGRNGYTTHDYAGNLDQVCSNLMSWHSWRRFLTGKSDYRYPLRVLPIVTHRIWDRLHGRRLPADANLPLLQAWRQLRNQKLPMLVLTADSAERRLYDACFARYIRPGRRDRIAWREIANTTHSLLAGGARDVVPRLVEHWIVENFPLSATRPAVAAAEPAAVAALTGSAAG